MFGIRKKIKSTIKQILHLDNESMPQSTVVEPEYQPKPQPAEPDVVTQDSKPEPQAAATQSQPPQEEQKAPTAPEPEKAAKPAPKVIQAQELNKVEGKALTVEAVQEILDDDIRPALQGDGGDITLIKIEDNNIYVRLVGACSTCPSSVATMSMFVENLLKEEFPALEKVIEVHDDAPMDADL